MVGDRTGLDALFSRIQRLAAQEPADEPSFDYGDYWAWKSNNLDTEHDFWMAELGDVRSPIQLALEPRDGGEPDGLLATMATTASIDLQAMRGTSPVAVVVAAAAMAVAEHFDDGRVELCLLTSARTHPETNDQLGYFLNPVPLRVDTQTASRLVVSLSLIHI